MTKKIIISAVVIAALAGGLVWWQSAQAPAVDAAPLAQCLTQKGAKMYGAYWCAHCQRQKKLFGSAFKDVTYVECAVANNPNEQTQACKDANVSSYPTWTFSDGSRLEGEQTFAELADKTGCPAP